MDISSPINPLDYTSSDENIIFLLKARDPLACELLTCKYAVPIQRFIAKCYSFISKEDIEDITQETLLYIWQYGEYDPIRSKFRTWVMLRSAYTARRFMERQQHITGDQLTDDNIRISWALARSIQVTIPADVEDISFHMEQALSSLPPRQATIIRLFYYEGRPYSEIAQQSGCKECTIKSEASRARKALRDLLHK